MGLLIFLLSAPMISGCEKSIEFNNAPPGSINITKDVCYLATEGTVELCGVAEDPEGDDITYKWTVAEGDMYPASGEAACIYWTAPSEPGVYELVLTVSDGIDSSSKTVEIEVGEEVEKALGEIRLVNNGYFYMISADIPMEVLSATDFVIEAGVTLVFGNRPGGLRIEGSFRSLGTASDPVNIKPNSCPDDPGVWSGIVFAGSSADAHLRHTNISGTADGGIYALDHATVRLDTCSVVNSIGRGIIAEDNSTLYMRGCKVWENSGGLELSDSYIRIEDCSIRYNTSYGLMLLGGTGYGFDAVIGGSTIANNEGDGFHLEENADPVVNGCAIFLNESQPGIGYAVKLYTPFSEDIIIDFTGNYWGFTNEAAIEQVIFDGNIPGSGIDATVDFSGWLTSSPVIE